MRRFPASVIRKVMTAKAFLYVVLIGAAFMGCTTKTDPSFEQGRQIYTTDCVGCHGPNGEGVLYSKTVLNNNAFVTGKLDEVITTILFGRAGNSAMPGWQKKLNDQEVAAVATYIRQAWSNQSDAVSMAMVAKIRGQKDEGGAQ
jgi:mono/diheme cytochrome c family protein